MKKDKLDLYMFSPSDVAESGYLDGAQLSQWKDLTMSILSLLRTFRRGAKDLVGASHS